MLLELLDDRELLDRLELLRLELDRDELLVSLELKSDCDAGLSEESLKVLSPLYSSPLH